MSATRIFARRIFFSHTWDMRAPCRVCGVRGVCLCDGVSLFALPSVGEAAPPLPVFAHDSLCRGNLGSSCLRCNLGMLPRLGRGIHLRFRGG